MEKQFDNSPEDYSDPFKVDPLVNALEVGDPHAEEAVRRVEEARREVRSQAYGSMFGVTASMRNMTEAFEGLLQFLPKDFVWPTMVNVSTFSVYAEWGRLSANVDAAVEDHDLLEHNTIQGVQRAVWLVAFPDVVNMNANFRPGWPRCEVPDFDARTAAGWLRELTANWEWSATQTNGTIRTTLHRR